MRFNADDSNDSIERAKEVSDQVLDHPAENAGKAQEWKLDNVICWANPRPSYELSSTKDVVISMVSALRWLGYTFQGTWI